MATAAFFSYHSSLRLHSGLVVRVTPWTCGLLCCSGRASAPASAVVYNASTPSAADVHGLRHALLCPLLPLHHRLLPGIPVQRVAAGTVPVLSPKFWGAHWHPVSMLGFSRLNLTSDNGSTATEILRVWCVLELCEALQGGQSVQPHQLVSPFPDCCRNIWGAIGT